MQPWTCGREVALAPGAHPVTRSSSPWLGHMTEHAASGCWGPVFLLRRLSCCGACGPCAVVPAASPRPGSGLPSLWSSQA